MRLRQRLLVLAVGLTAHAGPAAVAPPPTAFGALVERLSEGAGYFPSDNLVSNETSYLHVLGALRTRGMTGGAYLGVGPEQGFAYIAELHPDVAIMVDIRRDNLLLHLLFKAMFERSGNRLEYLCLLFGRPVPDDLYLWTDLDLDLLLDYLDTAPVDSAAWALSHRQLLARVAEYGVPLSDEDRATMARFHWEFASTGLELRYTNRGRRSFRPWFPSIRDIYQATDLEGGRGSYLATEDRWRTIRALERADGVIPVVGDVSGPRAVKAIAAYLRERRLTVSAFYLSNVESYLFRNGVFGGFVDNVRSLPADSGSVLIRSWFGRGPLLPGAVPGHLSTQQLHHIGRFLSYVGTAADTVSYWGLVTDAAAEPLSAVR